MRKVYECIKQRAPVFRSINEGLKDLAIHNKPYVKAGAVVGVTNIRKIVYSAVLLFSKRKLEMCNDLESAKAWLLGQS